MVSKFLYPRTIAVTRPQEIADVGILPYSGVQRGKEDLVVDCVPASVQAKAGSARPRAGDLPAAPPGPIQWNIYIPLSAVPKGTIKDRDIVTDDLGDRYHVEAAYWNSLGYKLITIRLEAH